MPAQKPSDPWEKLLEPGTLRANLITASLFITAFEVFRDAVVEKPKTFFMEGLDENGWIIGEEYRAEVLSKDSRVLTASLLWFLEMGAIDDSDMQLYQSIRRYRNDVVHEILKFISEPGREIEPEKLEALLALLSKIEKWWFTQFEMGVNPEALPEGADPEDVIAGSVWGLQLMLQIALGEEPEEGYYYNAYQEAKKSRT